MKYERNGKSSTQTPEVFSYLHYPEFLRDWLAFAKASQPGFSMSRLSKASGLSNSYLSMIFSGSRKIALNSLPELAQVMGLSSVEQNYLEALIIILDGKSQAAKASAYDRLNSLRPYQKSFQTENTAYQYLKNWYCVAIRELSAIPEFNPDPTWIQENLCFPVSLKDIRESLQFLIENKLIEVDQHGKIQGPGSSIGFHDGIHRIALTRFHREMFSLATRSIESIDKAERNILGYTLPVSDESFQEINAIINEAHQKIESIAKKGTPSSYVAHIEFALFPLSKRRIDKK